MVRVYKNYCTKLWEKLKENNVRCGCILKDGVNCSDFDEYKD